MAFNPLTGAKLVPTIKVKRKSDGQECIINESDFNDEEYDLLRVEPVKKTNAKKTVAKSADK